MIDERFLMHRFKATRLAVVVGVVLMFAFFTYNLVTTKVIRWDLFAIMLAMALTKAGAMIYFRKTN
jgi:hypothetical protein